MALAIQPFTFNYAPGRVTGVQSIDKPTWGPPDVSQLAFQGLSQLLPNAAKAYQGVQQQVWKERGLEAAGKYDFGGAAALGQPGGPYAPTTGGTQTVAPNVTAGGKLPSFAKVEGGAPNADIGGLISSTAATHALAPDYLTKLVSIETGGTFDPNSFNKGSKASGLGQFIPGTWKSYGNGASPFDPGANLDATARLTIDNAKTLRNALGREPTQGELYLAHQQGATSAAKLLQNPDARAFDIVPPRNVVSNLPGALRGQASGMTAGQFASLWTNRFGDAGSAFAAAPQQAPAAVGGAVASVPGDNPAQLRAEAQAYAQTNPEAARQMLARAQAAEAGGGGQAPVAPPNPTYASLGGQAMQMPQQAQGEQQAIQTGPSLFGAQTPSAGTPTMTLPQEAQQPAAPAPVQVAQAPTATPAPQAAAAAVAQSPAAVAQAPAPPMPLAPPPAQAQQAPQQNQQVMRTLLQAAIGSGDPTLQALAGQLMQQQQPGYKFLEAGGNVYRTDARGNIEPVVRGAGAGRFATLAPGDPRRPEGFANDPRTLQVDLSTGKVEPIEGPKEGRGGAANSDQILVPGDPARTALNIPDDGRSWRVRTTDNGKREIGPIDNPTDKESPAFKQETTLRGEFDTKIKDYRALRNTYEDLRTAATTPEPTTASDISMVFSFMKMLDPTSVVREGEYATAANSGSVSQTVVNTYNKLLTGQGLLDDKQRREFTNQAGAMLARSHAQAKRDEERYRTLAKKNKLDPDNVASIPDYKFEPLKPKPPAPGAQGGLGSRDNPIDASTFSDAEISALPKGSYVRKNGRLGVVE